MTTLQLPRWLREMNGVRMRHSEQKQVGEAMHHSTKESLTMKLMMIGVVLAIAGTSIELVSGSEHMTQRDMLSTSFVWGSFGMLVMIGIYGVTSAREIALHALASIPMAGAFAPAISWLIVRSLQLPEVTLIVIAPVALAIGIGGPYIVRRYGQQIADIVGNYGISRVKKEIGVDDTKQ